MRIAGLQKMTLLDFPGRVACTVFLGGCNFRCPYCHNSQLLESPQPLLTQQELLDFLKKRQGLLDGVCITGGEPTLQPELPQLLQGIRALGFKTKLDTNGSRPEMLRTLLQQGLVDYVAMDIKNCPGRYPATCGVEQLDLAAVEQSILLLVEGETDYELRTTLVEPLHDEAAMVEMSKWLEKLCQTPIKRLFLQPFVDRDTVTFDGFAPPQREKLTRYTQILSTIAQQVSVRGDY